MAVAKRKSSPKQKSSSRKRKTKRKSKRSSKPKIKLDKSSVVLFTGCIALACVILLAVSVFVNSPKNQSSSVSKEKQIVERVSSKEAKKETKDKKNKLSKNDETVFKKSSENKNPSTEQVKNTPIKEDSSVEQEKKSEKYSAADSNKSTENKNVVSPKPEPTPEKSLPKKVPTTPIAPVIPYAIPQAKKGATLVLIFDDAGQNVAKTKRYTDLSIPLAIAVLPKLPHSKDCADLIRSSGKEVMLHQPMQAENLKINPGPGSITPEMNTFEIAELVRENIAEVGPVAGLNNHEGSLITENVIKIGVVLDVAAEEGIYFVDSRTTSATKAPQAALERDMKILERDVFLDDVVNKDEILIQIYKALDIANKKGKAIIIGHVDKSVDIIPMLLRDMSPYLKEKGYKFALPSDIWKK